MKSKVRLQLADRNQLLLVPTDLDRLVPLDHEVRSVWRFVGQLDLSPLHDAIRAREGHPGRPPIDPAILFCLWLYATLEGIGSARELERLADYHHAYRWICGGVSVNHHTLSDFRVEEEAFLDDLLTRSVVALMEAGVASLEEVAQDGLRTRAAAGSSSFRRKATLEAKLAGARSRIEQLKAEVTSLARRFRVQRHPGRRISGISRTNRHRSLHAVACRTRWGDSQKPSAICWTGYPGLA
jgi:transposase